MPSRRGEPPGWTAPRRSVSRGTGRANRANTFRSRGMGRIDGTLGAAMKAEEDTPRAAFTLLPRRITLAVVAALLAASVLAWRITLEQSDSMSGMVMGLGQIGSRVQGSMSAAVFLTMWVTMMTAMMLPTVAPMVLAHLAVARRRGSGVLSTCVFVAGYLLVWSAIGAVALVAYWSFARLDEGAAQSRWLPALAGAILIVAGAYQFTSWKQACLDTCQSPFAFLATHDFSGGLRSALRAGVVHGAFCLGCCWALMLVLGVVGLMTLLWMAGLFVLFFVEKHWRHGIVLAKLAGGALIALGTVVIAWPAALAVISR
jgi:predicted metal-binding membrane protein